MRYVPGACIVAIVATCVATAGIIGAAYAGTAPEVGSGNVTTADPAVPRPGTQPCIVQLIPKQAFGRQGNDTRMDAAPHPFHYRPPAGCKGPWAKIVLEANFAVDAGEQYDRTVSIWLKNVNLYFGTTQEPSPGVAPSWQVQRDLTDYSSLLRTPGDGQILINNWINGIRSSVIHASARLLFYPADRAFPAPRVPDRVYALNGKGDMPAKLMGADGRLSRSIVFPANTTRVYLDLFAQPQAHDEFYYMCLPDEVIRKAGRPPSNGSIDRSQVCGGGSFREVEISIDGKRAGLAPVSPWIFTGGLDPFLWQPTPGAQTLNFLPWRVDLTPFAGVLSDSKPHSVSVQVLSAPNFFSVAGALLVYQDKHVEHTGGAVTRNTLQTASLTPAVTSTLATGSGGVNGDVFTQSSQHYVIEGYVDTPNGRMQSQVETTIGFGNTQQFASNGKHGRHHVTSQTARVDSTSSTTGAGSPARSLHKIIDYTLDVRTFMHAGQGNIHHRDVQVVQRFGQHVLQREQGLPFYQATMTDTHVGADHLSYHQGDRTSFASHGQSSTQNFRFTDSLGDCHQTEVQARDGKVTSFTRGQGCLDSDTMHWFVHPDGSPDSFGWRGRLQPRGQSAPRQ
ncbi:MAG: peptide-N4-asparagine amidase [Rhodanobacteraceae bacterium]